MSGRKSRTKGKVGEREAAKLLSDLTGKDWRRSQQFKGTETSCDIELVEGETKLWAEIKRTESTISKSLYDIMKQTEEECGSNIPFVMSRRNHEEWVVCVNIKHLSDFCEEFVRLKNGSVTE